MCETQDGWSSIPHCTSWLKGHETVITITGQDCEVQCRIFTLSITYNVEYPLWNGTYPLEHVVHYRRWKKYMFTQNNFANVILKLKVKKLTIGLRIFYWLFLILARLNYVTLLHSPQPWLTLSFGFYLQLDKQLSSSISARTKWWLPLLDFAEPTASLPHQLCWFFCLPVLWPFLTDIFAGILQKCQWLFAK